MKQLLILFGFVSLTSATCLCDQPCNGVVPTKKVAAALPSTSASLLDYTTFFISIDGSKEAPVHATGQASKARTTLTFSKAHARALAQFKWKALHLKNGRPLFQPVAV